MTRIFITPLASKLASLNSINIENIKGSGPRGRITKFDIEKHLSSTTSINQTNDESYIDKGNRIDNEIVDIPKIRRIIAEKLTQSKSLVPHFYLRRKAKLDDLFDFRTKVNSVLENKNKISMEQNPYWIGFHSAGYWYAVRYL